MIFELKQKKYNQRIQLKQILKSQEHSISINWIRGDLEIILKFLKPPDITYSPYFYDRIVDNKINIILPIRFRRSP